MVLLGCSAGDEDFVAVVGGSGAYGAAKARNRRSHGGDGRVCGVFSHDACGLCSVGDASSHPSCCLCRARSRHSLLPRTRVHLTAPYQKREKRTKEMGYEVTGRLREDVVQVRAKRNESQRK